MSTIQGTGGGVTLPSGFNFKVESWSANYSIETIETTGFDDGGFKVREPVIVSMDGSCEGTGEYNAATTAPLPAALADGSNLAVGDLETNAKASITLTAQTGCTYAFTAVVTGMDFSRSNDGKLEVTLNFESSGAVTQTWDEVA